MTDYKLQSTQYQAKLGHLGNLEAELERKQKEIPNVQDQLEENRERLATLEGEVKDYLVSEIGDKDLPGISKAVEEGNFRQAYEMLQGLDEEEELEELLSKPDTKVVVEKAATEIEQVTEPTIKGKNLCFLLDVNFLSGQTILQLKSGVVEALTLLQKGNKRDYFQQEVVHVGTRKWTHYPDKDFFSRMLDNRLTGTLTKIMNERRYNFLHSFTIEDLHKKSSFDTLLVTGGDFYSCKEKAIKDLKGIAEKGKLTVLYLGAKDPTDKDPALLQMSEFASVRCLPRYACKERDIENFMLEYAKNIIEEERKGLESDKKEVKETKTVEEELQVGDRVELNDSGEIKKVESGIVATETPQPESDKSSERLYSDFCKKFMLKYAKNIAEEESLEGVSTKGKGTTEEPELQVGDRVTLDDGEIKKVNERYSDFCILFDVDGIIGREKVLEKSITEAIRLAGRDPKCLYSYMDTYAKEGFPGWALAKDVGKIKLEQNNRLEADEINAYLSARFSGSEGFSTLVINDDHLRLDDYSELLFKTLNEDKPVHWLYLGVDRPGDFMDSGWFAYLGNCPNFYFDDAASPILDKFGEWDEIEVGRKIIEFVESLKIK